jgi:hypothetical protein
MTLRRVMPGNILFQADRHDRSRLVACARAPAVLIPGKSAGVKINVLQ